MINSKGSVIVRGELAECGLSGVVVVPDHGGQREYVLHDAGDDAAGCASSVVFEVELSLEGSLTDSMTCRNGLNRDPPGRCRSPLRVGRSNWRPCWASSCSKARP